jgi:hypothetical protein
MSEVLRPEEGVQEIAEKQYARGATDQVHDVHGSPPLEQPIAAGDEGDQNQEEHREETTPVEIHESSESRTSDTKDARSRVTSAQKSDTAV